MIKEKTNKKLQIKYPYQELGLNDLPGERWKELPGLEGYYCISNFGRVRREEFEIICSNGQIRRMKPLILKCDITKAINHYIKDEYHALRIRITSEGRQYSFSIGRIVYYCFIKKFDLHNYSLVVIEKDCDSKNIRPDNLLLVDLQRKQQRMHERGRYKRAFIYAHDEYLNEGLIKSANPSCVQISQYDLSGKKMSTFPSITAAAVVTGITPVSINAVLKERQPTSGGYYWRYGKAKRINVQAEKEKRVIHRKEIVGQKVSQYDVNGNLVKRYLTISDAAKAVGIGSGDISVTLQGKQKSAGGYLWRKGWGKKSINIKGLLFGEVLRAQRRSKPIKQYTLDGKYLRTFESVKAAAEALKIKPANISVALNKNRTANGFTWKTVKKR